MTRTAVVVRVAEPGWRKCGVDAAGVRAAAGIALKRGIEHKKLLRNEPARAVTVLLMDNRQMQDLNARFRGENSPTNVLSFPAPSNVEDYLGDVAIALGVTACEAAAAGKRLSHHVQHLTVHGVLHLLGYDHVKPGEARTMEHLEIAVLHELGVANPYAMRV
jgi:probable rRNA maturation factor